MKLTNHEEYGLRCLLRLAEQGSSGSATIPEVSRAEGISEAYTAKLLRILRQSGLVKAERGKIGGYVLARPAREILIADVMEALGGQFFEERFCAGHSGQRDVCVRSADCSLRGLWQDVQAAVDRVLSDVTLADLLHRGKDAAEAAARPGNQPVSSSSGRTYSPGSDPLQLFSVEQKWRETRDV